MGAKYDRVLRERDEARDLAIRMKHERDELQAKLKKLDQERDALQDENDIWAELASSDERRCKTCKLRNMLVGLINDVRSGDWSWSEITEKASIVASEFKAWEARDE